MSVRKPLFLALLLFVGKVAMPQQLLTLEQCRNMALEHNHKVIIAGEHVRAAESLKKSAKTQFLPSISANGMYMRTNKELSILENDLLLPVIPYSSIDPTTGTFNPTLDPTNTFVFNPMTGQPVTDANGNPIFQNYSWLPKDEVKFGNKNIYTAGVSLTQPVFTGGKIRETYNIAKYGENLARASEEAEKTEVLYKTEEAYWRVVAVNEKVKLVNSYIKLLEKLNSDLENYFAEGIIIRNDLLKVKVKINEAQLNLLKVNNGFSLAKMALCQQVGLPLSKEIILGDSLSTILEPITHQNFADTALTNRPEIEALYQSINIAKSGVNLMKSRYMPNVGLSANYLFSNPNPYNGMKEEFGGDWNVGVAINIPIFHWNDKGHTLNAARSEQRVAELRMDEAKELISLQVQQAVYTLNESVKKIEMAEENLKQAEENLKVTNDALEVGTQKTSDVLEAQSMWQNAYSNLIDARMEYRLNLVNLKKVMGNLK